MKIRSNKKATGHGTDQFQRSQHARSIGLTAFDVRLAEVIDSPNDLEGMAQAVRRIGGCVRACVQVQGSNSSFDQWLQEVEVSINRFAELSQTHHTLNFFSATGGSSVYPAFARPIKANLRSQVLAKIDAAMGVVILHSLVIGRIIPSAATAAWARLQGCGAPRAGRHPDWEECANAFPSNLSEVQAVLQKYSDPQLIGFLKVYQEGLRGELPHPSALIEQGGKFSAIAGHKYPSDGGLIRIGEENRQAQNRALTDPPPSYVGWLMQRANMAGHLGHLGSEGRWEKQSIEELRHVCSYIVKAAATESKKSDRFALFACLSLASGLPANLLLRVNLTPNTDLWFDPAGGTLHWCLLRVLDNELAKELSHDRLESRHIVDIWLPLLVAGTARQLVENHRDAISIGELLTGSREEDEQLKFLDAYREWLTSLGPSSLHRVYDARWARSLGQVYRFVANDSVAAFMSLDFEECATGMLHYLKFTSGFVHGKTEAAYLKLGLGPPVPLSECSRAIGSSGAMNFEQFLQGLSTLLSDRAELLLALNSAESISTCCDIYNQINDCDHLLELCLTGGRDKHFERLTWGQLHGHPKYILKADKDLENYTKFRLLPVHAVLRASLDLHVEASEVFCRRVEALGGHSRSPRGRNFDDRSPHRVFFARANQIIKEGRCYILRSLVSRTSLEQVCEKYLNGQLNVGRHTILTHAAQTQTDPWLWKCLSGHHRGFVEPFSDGMGVSPRRAMALLEHAVDEMFAPLMKALPQTAKRGTLSLLDLTGRLPDPSQKPAIGAAMQSRLLRAPFDGYTLPAARVIDHLSQLLSTGCGPEHRGARLLLNLHVVNWVRLADCELVWQSPAPFLSASVGCGCVTWRRPNTSSEYRVPLAPSTLIAMGDLHTRHPRDWQTDCTEAARWLRFVLPRLSWSSNDATVLGQLDALLIRWMRVHLPPLVLAVVDPVSISPTASTATFCALVNGHLPEALDQEVLVLPRPKPRGVSNIRKGTSAFQQLVALVHEHADPATHKGEDWQLMKDLAGAASEIDVSGDLSAPAMRDCILAEAELWKGSKGGRIQVSTFSTYLYLLNPALAHICPIHNLKEWFDEWRGLMAYLIVQPGEQNREKTEALNAQRLTAAKRILGTLSRCGFSIPSDLFEGQEAAKRGQRPRDSAASVVLGYAHRVRCRNLMTSHFDYDPLLSELAGLYTDLRFEGGLRSLECAVLPIEAIDDLGRLVVTTDGFSSLKSDNARRFVFLTSELTEMFKSTTKLVKASHPGAKWLFLFEDREDWTLVVNIEKAFSAALKQATGDSKAVPHSARSVRALACILPKWEHHLGAMLQGTSDLPEFLEFEGHILEWGFELLASILRETGHSHPLTYLKYYFALGDLVLGFLNQAQLLRFGNVASLIGNARPEYRSAFVKARQRGGTSFHEVQWLIKKELQRTALPSLAMPARASLVPSKQLATPTQGLVRATKCSKIAYLAARFAGHPSTSAAHDFEVETVAARELERLLQCQVDIALMARHQGQPSSRGLKAEVSFLKSRAGYRLVQSIEAVEKNLLVGFLEDLSPKRTYKSVSPTLDLLKVRLLRYLAVLPPELGLLIQFSPSGLPPEALQQIAQLSPRLHLGSGDSDLGRRPRLSLVHQDAPANLVLRARRTSGVRCVLASTLLLNQ